MRELGTQEAVAENKFKHLNQGRDQGPFHPLAQIQDLILTQMPSR